MKHSFWQEFGKPILVLFLITASVGVLLGFVHSVTEPIITENERIRAEADQKAALPGAKEFLPIEFEEGLGITGAYRETAGLGYVFTAGFRGYGGIVSVTVGLDPDGAIVRVIADVSTETTGIGKKAGEDQYLARYSGLSGTAASVDAISGATYSSVAIRSGVETVLTAYEKLVKGE